MPMATAHDDYEAALREARDRNTHRKRPQNVAIFLVHCVPKPAFLVRDCGVDYRPELPTIHDPAAQVARIGMVDRRRCVFEYFTEA